MNTNLNINPGNKRIKFASSDSIIFLLLSYSLFIIVFYYFSIEEVIELRNSLVSLEIAPNAVLKAGINFFGFNQLIIGLFIFQVYQQYLIYSTSDTNHFTTCVSPKLSGENNSLLKDYKTNQIPTRHLNLTGISF